MPFGLDLFSSDSESSVSTSSEDRTFGFQDVQGAIAVSDEGTVNVIDAGAVRSAQLTAQAAIDANSEFGADALRGISDVNARSLLAVGAAFEQANRSLAGSIDEISDASRSDSTAIAQDLIRFGGLAAVGVALFFFFNRGR